MIENKLKFMLENNKLDGLINNKSEAEKLCKLGTTEEVLDLLNKYDYNETKEVFERELLEILQDINLTEEELNKVTGGKISHRQQIAKFLGVVSLAGSINMPTTMAGNEAPVSAVAKKKDKNSGWMSHPKEDTLVKTFTGLVGAGGFITLGTLLFYGGKKLLGSSDITLNAATQELSDIIDDLVTDPTQLTKINIDTIHQEDLENYAIGEFKSWSEIMRKSYDKNSGTFTDPNAWNDHFDTLLKIRWAIWLLSVKLGLLTYDELATFTEGRTFEAPGTLNATARKENHPTYIRLPGDNAEFSMPLGGFWSGQQKLPCIGFVCLSLLELPLTLDRLRRQSQKPVFAITNLSKEFFGNHFSPTDHYWGTMSYTNDDNFDNIIQDDADRENSENKSDDRESSMLAELANLEANNEKWDGNLENVNHIVVSLIQEPMQNYTELVKNISSDDLKTYAEQGLKLWCNNTKANYDEKTRSITNTDTWNANYGLLVKARWAVWLLLIKEKKVETERLTSYVALRRFDKGSFLGDSGNFEWYEYIDLEVPPTTLTNPSDRCFVFSPWIGNQTGNVCFAVWSLNGDLPEKDPAGRYTELKRGMEEIATETLPNCMTDIPLQEDMDEQKVQAGEIPQVSATPDPSDIDFDDLLF